jgi:threonylcarbamoyladenosine tRNA methylthiotransferase MtaB
MGRPYDAATYAALVCGLRARQPGLAMGADVIVGFPGETDAEFAETVRFLEALPLAYLHVFTFSPRPRTPAAEWPDQVPGPVRQERNRVLRALSERKRVEFAAAQVGSWLELVMETGDDGRRYGLSDNYLHVEGVGEEGERMVAMRITGATGAWLQGVPGTAPLP